MRHTLRKKDILRGYGAYQEVFAGGEVFAEKQMKIIVLREENKVDDQMLKIGFAVGNRLRSAVARNRLKRRMREIVRIHKNVLVQQCIDGKISRLIFLCLPIKNRIDVRACPNYTELEREFFQILPRLSSIKGKK